MRLRDDLYNPKDIDQIHAATVKLLNEKGIYMPNEKALKIFKDAGARVEDQIVYISEEMLNSALEKCPSKFVLRGRVRERDFEIGGEKPCLCQPNGPIFVKFGDKYWASTKQDVINFMKLTESSPTVDMVTPWVATANDVPIEKQLAYQYAVTLKYSTKPTLGLTASYELCKMSIRLTRDFYGIQEDGEYVCLGLVSPISPMSYNEEMLDAVIAYAEENQPLFFASAVLPGATGPVTLAGAIAMSSAEVLAGIVLAELVHPGVPVIFGNAAGSTDLHYVTPAIGSPEAGLTAIYVRGLGDKYGIPCRAGGALADSKCTDMQAGIESTMVMLPSILAGIDFILHGGGILDSYNVISYDKFLMDEEMTKMCMYMKNGVEVTEETLAVDTIMEVEHGGEFLTEEHTLDHMYDMLYIPELLEKNNYAVWSREGSRPAVEKAKEAVQKRLDAYKETPLTEYQESLIAEYLDV